MNRAEELIADLEAEIVKRDARIGVVLPERDDRTDARLADYVEGWNECLDEVARLNPSRGVPEESELEKVLCCGDASHDEQEESAHHIRLLAGALGECIQAAGITRPGAALNGPELLMFANDLKEYLLEVARLNPPGECVAVPRELLIRLTTYAKYDHASADQLRALLTQQGKAVGDE